MMGISYTLVMGFPGSGRLSRMVSLFLFSSVSLSGTLHITLVFNLHHVSIACPNGINFTSFYRKLRLLTESETWCSLHMQTYLHYLMSYVVVQETYLPSSLDLVGCGASWALHLLSSWFWSKYGRLCLTVHLLIWTHRFPLCSLM